MDAKEKQSVTPSESLFLQQLLLQARIGQSSRSETEMVNSFFFFFFFFAPLTTKTYALMNTSPGPLSIGLLLQEKD